MFLKRLRDIDVRHALRAVLRRRFSADSVILEEMVVPGRDSRIDMAVVNGSLHGFEIKSEVDTLRRLTTQRDSYNCIFDRVTLVVASRHQEKALTVIPSWWGLGLAAAVRSRVGIKWIRPALRNPTPDPEMVVRLLRREEVEEAIREANICSATDRYYVYELNRMLVANMTTGELAKTVRLALKRRHKVSSRQTLGDG